MFTVITCQQFKHRVHLTWWSC